MKQFLKKGEFAKMNFMEKLTDQQKIEISLFLTSKERTLEEIKRAQGVLLLEEKASSAIILSLTGLKKTTLVKARKKYIKNGIIALQSKRIEKKPRDLLTKNQRKELEVMLNTKTPQDYGWGWDYWTPTVLGHIILKLYNVKYKSKTSLYLIFKRSKLTYHKPDKIYKNRNQEVIDQWKKDNFEVIQKALLDTETVVLVEDEMILTSQTTTQKVWLPKGEKAYVVNSNTRKRKSFYGFLDIKTGKEIAFIAEKQTNEISAQILKQVLDMYKGKKVLLLWDNAPWHRGEFMREFLKTCSNFLIINFPPYAPDENPQEHVWKAGRANVTHNKFISNIDKIAQEFVDYLNNNLFKYEFFGFTA